MKHGRAWVTGGFRPAIIKEGPKWSQVVYIDGSRVRVAKVKGEVTVKPVGFSMVTLARALLRRKNVLGIQMHISKTAKRILQEALQTSSGS